MARSRRGRSNRMGRKDSTRENPTAARPAGWRPWHRLCGLVSTALLLSGILYGTALALSRTSGFRRLLADHLGAHLGEAAELDAAALMPNGTLRLANVRFGDPEKSGAPAVRIRRAGLALDWPWHPHRLRAFEADDMELRFTRTAKGGDWSPQRLSSVGVGIGRWIGLAFPFWRPAADDAADLAHRSEGNDEGDGVRGGFPRDDMPTRIHLRNATISWWDEDGVCRAGAEGLDLEATTVALPNRRLTHVRLSADRLQGARGEEFVDLRAEFIAVGPHRLLLDFNAGAAGP